MASKYVPENKSGTFNKSTPNNNVFEFINVFRENLSNLQKTKTIKCLDSQGKEYQKIVTDDEQIKIKTLGEQFIVAFEDYLQNGDYTKSDVDLTLAQMKLSGKTNKQVHDELGMPASTIRVRYARLTKKIYRKVFNQDVVPKGLVTLESTKVIRKAYASIRKAQLAYTLKGNMNYTQYTEVMKKISGVGTFIKDFDEDEYLRALRFYLLYSNDVFNYYLNSISPKMLAYVKEKLELEDLGNTILSYATALDDIPKFLSCSELEFRSSFSDVADNQSSEVVTDLDDFTPEPVIYNLAISQSLADKFTEAIAKYDNYVDKQASLGVVPKMERIATQESRQKAQAFLKSLTDDVILNEVSKLNPYDFVTELKKNYIISGGNNYE